ncbi:putative hydro-lyase [Candidatus Bipolaricaulota bacterium]
MKDNRSQQPTQLSGIEARAVIRSGEWTGPTAGLASGFVQANLVILPSKWADDFERFCRLNPRPLPLLERVELGSSVPAKSAPTADLRTDVPQYHVFETGEFVQEVTDLQEKRRDDWVAFLLGCSFTFDWLLQSAGIPVRHLEQGCNVPMYETSRALQPSGPFSGNLVVSMRPVRNEDVAKVIELTTPLKLAHGAPIHVGSPTQLGILDLELPEYGDAVTIRDDEVPVFWACGVTAQQVARASRIPLMVTHAPGHMFITDLKVDDLENLSE